MENARNGNQTRVHAFTLSLFNYNDNYFFSGAFLLVYFIAMFLCGIPIFFQEVAIGQYLGSGGMTLVAQLCPILKGKYFMITKKTVISFENQKC